MNKKLLVIFLLGLLIRIIFLDKFPTGFTPDEASFGYDAYSILKTGKDQWGHKFPIVLESFGDFKAPVYSYLTILFIPLFDLTRFSVRLPNALLGSGSIIVTYFLVMEILSYINFKRNEKEFILITSCLLLAISPWHIMMSRGAFEANLTTFFLPFFLLLFLKGLKKPNYLIFSSLVFGINLFTYHSAKFVTPLIFLFTLIVFKSEVLKLGVKKILPFFGIVAIFVLLLSYTFFIGAGARVKDLTISRGALEAASQERIVAQFENVPSFVARVFHNKYQVFIRRFISNYFQYFSLQFLFTNGPSESTYGMVRERGVLYWFELPLLIGTIIFFARIKRSDLKIISPIVFWLLAGPIPASLASGPGYAANRAVVVLPSLQILLSFGALEIYKVFKSLINKNRLRVLKIIYFTFSILIFCSFLEDYFIQSPVKIAKSMLYGNLEAMYWLKENFPQNTQVIVSKRLSEPHIYVAFANKIEPEIYQEEVKEWYYRGKGLLWVDQMDEYKLGNYIFKNIDFESDLPKTNLLVGRPEDFPFKVSRLKTFNYPSLEEAILVVEGAKNAYAQNLQF